MMRREWSHYVDLLRDDLWKNHPKIQIVDFDFYDVNAFNQCENNDCVLMAVPKYPWIGVTQFPMACSIHQILPL